MELTIPKDVKFGEMFVVNEAGLNDQHRSYLMVRSSYTPETCSVVAIATIYTGKEAPLPDAAFKPKAEAPQLFNVNFQGFVTGEEEQSELVKFENSRRVEPNDPEVRAIFRGWGKRNNVSEAELIEVIRRMRIDANLDGEFAIQLESNVKAELFVGSSDSKQDTRR